MYPDQPTPNQPPVPPPSPQPQPVADPQPASQPTYQQQPPAAYNTSAQPAYDPNYLDSIAPPPPRPKFFSGSFGKIFFAMLGVFVLAVSLIIAFSGGDNTADLQQIAVRLDNFSQTAKTVQKNLKSNNLNTTNSNFMLWMTDSQHDAEELLGIGGVKKTDYSKTMVASEKQLAEDLDAKFEDARLSARLDRIYAATMAAETEKMINLFTVMSKKSQSQAIRDYAKDTSANLIPIQKSFDEFVDDGN